MGKLVDMEAGRLRRWERKQNDPFKPRTDGQLIWTCRCGGWQFEVRPVGVFCISCGDKQYLSTKP